MTNQKTLSISIVTYAVVAADFANVLHALKQALLFVKVRNADFSAEIFIVDNGGQSELLSKLIVDVQTMDFVECIVISGQGNIGYAWANNLALAKTQSEYHLVMNPDVYVADDALWQGMQYMINNHFLGFISPYAEDKQGHPVRLCKRYPAFWTLFLRGFCSQKIQSYFKSRLDDYEMQDLSLDSLHENIPLISGCFMFAKTSSWQALNGFDECFFLYFEDYDLSHRAARKFTNVFLPAMKIKHWGGQTAGKGWLHIRYFMVSAWRFFNKHGWKF